MDRNYNSNGYYNPRGSFSRKRKADEELSYFPTKKSNLYGQYQSNAGRYNNRRPQGRGYSNNRWRGPYNRHNNFNISNRLPTNVPYPGNDNSFPSHSKSTNDCNDKTPNFSGNSPQLSGNSPQLSGNSPQLRQSLQPETRYSANNRLKRLRTELQKPANEDGKQPPTSTNALLSSPNTSIQERLSKSSVRPSDGNSQSSGSSLKNRLNVHNAQKSLWYRPSEVESFRHPSLGTPQTIIATIKIEDTEDTEEVPVDSNSVSQSINNNSPSEEKMDWSPTNEYNIINYLQDLRENVIRKSRPLESQTHQEISKELAKIERNETHLKQTYVVVDTNIFLLHLDVVEKVMHIKLNGNTDVVDVYAHVPWTVLKELDVIKSGRTQHHEYMRVKAQKAIRFINNSLTKKLHLTGQSMVDFSRDDYSVTNNDDDIVRCCRQILEKNNRAILLSNDINLRNKAISSGIQAFNHSDILDNLNPFINSSSRPTSVANKVENSEKYRDIELQFSKILSILLIKVFESAYGNVWDKLVLLKEEQPWSLTICLNIIEYYWRSVFGLDLPIICLDRVKQLQEMIKDGITNLDRLLELGMGICNDFKNTYDTCINTVLNGMNMLKNTEK